MRGGEERRGERERVTHSVLPAGAVAESQLGTANVLTLLILSSCQTLRDTADRAKTDLINIL